jgi:hypothetical protein
VRSAKTRTQDADFARHNFSLEFVIVYLDIQSLQVKHPIHPAKRNRSVAVTTLRSQFAEVVRIERIKRKLRNETRARVRFLQA